MKIRRSAGVYRWLLHLGVLVFITAWSAPTIAGHGTPASRHVGASVAPTSVGKPVAANASQSPLTEPAVTLGSAVLPSVSDPSAAPGNGKPAQSAELSPGVSAQPSAQVRVSPFMFGVYPGGNTGEMPSRHPIDPAVVVDRITELRGATRPFNVQIYCAWRDVDADWFWPFYDAQYERYGNAGLSVTMVIRYYPPNGRAGDSAGFADFVRTFVRRYGAHPAAHRFVIGNEGNATENPEASDGAVYGAQAAIVVGVIGAQDELSQLGSRARLGINVAVTQAEADAAYLWSLIARGGAPFRQAIAFVGVDVYPGLWPVGSGDVYADMTRFLGELRGTLTAAGFGRHVMLDILENGFPTTDERGQADRLDRMVQAVLDHRDRFGVASYCWFALWDADSNSHNPFGHYGLLRSDLTPKLAFTRYRALISTASLPAAEPAGPQHR